MSRLWRTSWRPARQEPASALSGRPYRIEELADFELEAVTLARQRLRRRMNLRGGRSGLAGAALHVRDVRGGLRGAFGRMLDVAGYFLACRALLFHRRGNGRGNLRHPADGVADLLDRAHRILRGGLDSGDLQANLAGRLRGLLGERLHLGRHHRKAAASIVAFTA